MDEVWNSANPLFKWRFDLLSSRNLLPWQRDVTTSPLYYVISETTPPRKTIRFEFSGITGLSIQMVSDLKES